MAHIEHYKLNDVKRVVNEHFREKWEDRQNRIDSDKTEQNYILCSEGTHPFNTDEFYNVLQERMEQVKHSTRKDLNVVSEWCITCPRELLNDTQSVNKFFELSYGLVSKRYGSENILCAFVHVDETTPHMHIDLVPVTDDGVISAKRVFDRKELRDFHKLLDLECEREFQIKNLCLNGRTKGNYTTDELRERTKDEQELARSRKRNFERVRELDEREQSVSERERSVSERESKQNALQSELQEKQESIRRYVQKLKEREQAVSEREQAVLQRESEQNILQQELQEERKQNANAIRYYAESVQRKQNAVGVMKTAPAEQEPQKGHGKF